MFILFREYIYKYKYTCVARARTLISNFFSIINLQRQKFLSPPSWGLPNLLSRFRSENGRKVRSERTKRDIYIQTNRALFYNADAICVRLLSFFSATRCSAGRSLAVFSATTTGSATRSIRFAIFSHRASTFYLEQTRRNGASSPSGTARSGTSILRFATPPPPSPGVPAEERQLCPVDRFVC